MNSISETNSDIEQYLSGEIIDNAFKFDVSFLSSEKTPKSRIETILEVTKGAKVLHVGCADHIELIDKKMKNNNHLHKLLMENCSFCLGIDINKDAIEYLKDNYNIDNIMYADIFAPDFKRSAEVFSRQWDYAILGEMLEHTNNPVSFLEKIREIFKGSVANVLITVPNVYSPLHVRFYTKNKLELINSDHRFWFSPYTLAKVMHESGIKIERLIPADPPSVFSFLKIMKFGKRAEPNQKAHLSSTLIGIGKIA